MRADDRKRLSKIQQKARKDKVQEERIRQKNERQTPLILDAHSSENEGTSEESATKSAGSS